MHVLFNPLKNNGVLWLADTEDDLTEGRWCKAGVTHKREGSQSGRGRVKNSTETKPGRTQCSTVLRYECVVVCVHGSALTLAPVSPFNPGKPWNRLRHTVLLLIRKMQSFPIWPLLIQAQVLPDPLSETLTPLIIRPHAVKWHISQRINRKGGEYQIIFWLYWSLGENLVTFTLHSGKSRGSSEAVEHANDIFDHILIGWRPAILSRLL